MIIGEEHACVIQRISPHGRWSSARGEVVTPQLRSSDTRHIKIGQELSLIYLLHQQPIGAASRPRMIAMVNRGAMTSRTGLAAMTNLNLTVES